MKAYEYSEVKGKITRKVVKIPKMYNQDCEDVRNPLACTTT